VKVFKAAVRTGVTALLPEQWADNLLTAKQALWWRTVERDWYRTHFAQDHGKDLLKPVLSRVRSDAAQSRPLSILEFGCNAGNNLYTLRRDPATADIAYCGVDINPKAIAFAKKQFPSDSFHIGDHRWFIRHAGELGTFDLFVASHVLYYIDGKHTRLVLESARRIAHYVLVADRMQRFSHHSGERADLFTHPYASICRDLGLEVLEIERGDVFGHFLARTGH
jgi:SAM-dependent methyltransferase